MDYALPPSFVLPPTRGHTYEPLQRPDAWQHLAALLPQPATWHVALKLTEAPTEAALDALVRVHRRVALWNMVPRGGGARVATCVLSTYAADWHVAVLHAGPWSPARHVEAMDALSSSVLRGFAAVQEVWTALPLPEPAGAEEALVALNFTHVPSGLDAGSRRTYGLFRYIWQAYRGG